MIDLNIPTDLTASILAGAAQKGAAKTKPKSAGRRTFTVIAMEQAMAGNLPDPMVVPASNKHAGLHAEKMLALAKAGDAIALRDHQITGTNSYAKMLRAYRDALLTYVDRVTAKVAEEQTADPVQDRMAKVRAAKAAKAMKVAA
jgi:hypothetical protein